ncbi:fumarylacetoacetate hydrolase family protein [Sphingobium xenophagum]
MRFVSFVSEDRPALGLLTGSNELIGLFETDPDFPGDIKTLLAGGREALEWATTRLSAGAHHDIATVRFLPPVPNAGKIVCIGLNYAEHAAETGNAAPPYPAIFARFNSSLTAHEVPVVVPELSPTLDYEGELAVIIGKGGRGIKRDAAHAHIAGYAVFNDITVRGFQMKSSQWTMGKNFDNTGAFGPAFVTADELPLGAKGLTLETRLNGRTVQSASTSDMIFDVAHLVELVSTVMTLEPGDIIVSGTPSGVGIAYDPPRWMKPGDVCEVEIEGVGRLRNRIVSE